MGPLLALLRREGVTVLSLERLYGVDARQFHRCKARGWCGYALGDEVAQALGYHPIEIWPLEWIDLGEG